METYCLIYLNHLPSGFKTNVKLFADVTSLFIIVKDKNDESLNALNSDLSLISKWDFNWKMLLIQIHINLLKRFYFQRIWKYQFIVS